LKIRIRQIKDFIYDLEEKDRVVYESVINLFKEFIDKEFVEYEKLNKEIKICVKNNVLFVDPAKGILKPQSKLDLLAIRKIVR